MCVGGVLFARRASLRKGRKSREEGAGGWGGGGPVGAGGTDLQPASKIGVWESRGYQAFTRSLGVGVERALNSSPINPRS